MLLHLFPEDLGECEEWIQEVSEGLMDYSPEICEEGLNGTYFLRDKDGEMAAVFKPQDEEGNSENNPKRFETSDFMEKGILDGEGAQREVAAYLLDREDGFSGVPNTTLVKIAHPSFGIDQDGKPRTKTGSLQQFVRNDGASWDIGFNAFPANQVHKIGILDLRIFNNDRHGGNMLMDKQKDGSYNLTPIDHGFSLSSTLNRAWFDWLTWPQAKKPFSKESLDYIAAIDPEKDLEKLGKLRLRQECLRTLKISTMVLKKGAACGLTLYDIGYLASRSVMEEPSGLELLHLQALKACGLVDGDISAEEEEKLLNALAGLVDAKFANPTVETVRAK